LKVIMPPNKTKTRTQFVCQQCGSVQLKWLGRCPDCGEWNTFVEVVEEKSSKRDRTPSGAPRATPTRLKDVQADALDRLPMAMKEFSRVLGGGIVPGCLVLVSGDPGIGKSTLLMQVATQMSDTHGPVLYVSGEESAQQIKMRADRLNGGGGELYLLTETDLDEILIHIQNLKPRLAIIDSIQTVYVNDLTSAPGSISQVRESAARLQGLAKSSGVSIFIVGHVTKSGSIAGPKVLEHIVDTVLYLEGDRFHTYRLLRSTKNRFGATDEVGVFEMRGSGMAEVANPSEMFLAERLPSAPGSSIAVTMEGTRPLLVEVQALCSTSAFGLPRRTANGLDINRLLLITAVLSKRIGLKLGDQDIFANVIGGLHIGEPAADLATACSIASSMRDRPVAADLAIIGEVGLSGELRTVGQLPARLNEAAKLGFKRVLIPKTHRLPEAVPDQLELLMARSVGEALAMAMGQT
jgi:DNA repair protein RadA/Sms